MTNSDSGSNPPKTAQAGGDGAARASLIKVAFPEHATIIFGAALVIGLVLIGLPTIFRSHFAVNGVQSNLVLCVGIAVLLAAFGGQATVRVGGMIVAGAAAIAIAFFVYLQQQSQSLFLEGSINAFDFDKYEDLHIAQKYPVLGRISQNPNDPRRSRYDFVMFKKEVDGQIIDIGLVVRGARNEKALAVQTRDIESAFGSQRLEWELREETDGQDKVLALYDRATNKVIARENIVGIPHATGNPFDLSLIGTAIAQVPSTINVGAMLERLKSDDAATRRAARDAIGHAPIESIPTIMQTFQREWGNYQVRLGVCVALAQMLRNDKSLGPAISGKLREDDLNRLLDAAADPDRTVRVYAAEFLFDLGDPRVTNLAIRRAAATTDETARYNWVLVAQDGWRKLSPAEKGQLSGALGEAKRRSGTNTRALFDKLQ